MRTRGAAHDDVPFDLLTRARTVLLDAVDALAPHRDAVVVIGAQAVYLHTGGLEIALAEATKDSDVALDPRVLGADPRIEAAMAEAGFLPGESGQPGAWVSADGIPVDLMVPEHLAGAGGKQARAARLPPHARTAARRARGLEAALVDHREMSIPSLLPGDDRRLVAKVAGPAALLVAKCHKIAERVHRPDRLSDKDAHDIYRLLVKFDPEPLATTVAGLLADELSGAVAAEAVEQLARLFAAGPEAIGSRMAGRAEAGVGEPEQVSAAVHLLAEDLLVAIRSVR